MNDVLDSIEEMLVCPVCLLMPRQGPIPSCPAGHIVCKTCRGNLTTCPTCRRELNPSHVSSLASGMIDLVRHSCKFKDFGCTVKECLNTLKKHESDCDHRTVCCPVCEEEVELKKFYMHAISSTPQCIVESHEV